MSEPTRDKIIIVDLIKTCWACPAQWDMYDKNSVYYYVRYRWGCLSVSLGVGGDCLFQEMLGDGYDGYMETEAMKQHVSDVFEFE